MAIVKLELPGGGPAIADSIKHALMRAGHAVSGGAAADLRIGIWQVGMPLSLDGPPLVRWWTGSDVSCLADGRTERHDPRAEFNWVGSAALKQELESLGVRARQLPVVPMWAPRAHPFTEPLCVMTYCPTGREELYRWNDLLKVAAVCPEFEFLVYRRGNDASAPQNVTGMGDVPHGEMPAEYLRVAVVLRLVQHDGMSLSVLEGLSFGRRVIWSHGPFPGVRQADDWYQAVYFLREEIARGPNREGVSAMATLRRAADGKLALYVADVLDCQAKEPING